MTYTRPLKFAEHYAISSGRQGRECNYANYESEAAMSEAKRTEQQIAQQLREKGISVIAVGPEQKCSICGKVEETRPYGPNYTKVCFDCAMKDEDGTKLRAGEFI
jgi:hypothetical protein